MIAWWFAGLLGCSYIEDFSAKVEDGGVDALESARSTVRQAEASPAKRRVLKIVRQLRSDINRGKEFGLKGNGLALLVQRAAEDGEITGIEAGAIEDAYHALAGD